MSRARIIVGIIAGLIASIAVGDGFANEPKLMIGMGGQSNCVGFASQSNLTNINKYFANQYNAVRLRQQDGTNANPPVYTTYPVEGVKARTNSPTLNMGLELSCSRYLNLRAPDMWAMAKDGIGSTSLADHWRKGSVYPTIPPNLYARHITFLKDSMRILNAVIAAYVFPLGETDATDAADAAAFQVNQTQYIADIRADLGNPTLPVILLRLHINNPGAHKLTIRAAQEAIASSVPGVFLIDVDDLTLQGDNLHFTADSYITLGNRVGAAIMTALGMSKLLARFTTTYKGRTIDVTDKSTSDGSSVTTWEWDWGDGSAHDTTQNASHTYSEDTPRTITLTVGNALGQTKTFTEDVRPVLRTWAFDATAQKAYPATEAERAQLSAAHALDVGAWSDRWGCQSAGNQVSNVGALRTLIATGSPGTQLVEPGHDRLAIGASGAAANQLFSNNIFANAQTTNAYVQLVGRFNSSAAIRALLHRGTTAGNEMTTNTASQKGRYRNGAQVGLSSLDWTNITMPLGLLWRLPGALGPSDPGESAIVTPIEVLRVPVIALGLVGTELRVTVGSAADAAAFFRVLVIEHWEASVGIFTIEKAMKMQKAYGWPVDVPGFPDL